MRIGVATSRLSIFLQRARSTIEKPMPHIPVPIRFMPSSAREQEVDVARALLVHLGHRAGDGVAAAARRAGARRRPRAARSAHRAASGRSGTRTGGGLDQQRDLPGPQASQALRRASVGRSAAARARFASAPEIAAAERPATTPTGTGSAGRSRNAKPRRRPEEREDEDPEHRLRLAHELRAARRRSSARSSGCCRSLIAQLPSGQGDEDVFERRAVRRERHQPRAGAVELGEQGRHRRGERGDGERPLAVPRRRSPMTPGSAASSASSRPPARVANSMMFARLQRRDQLRRRAERR